MATEHLLVVEDGEDILEFLLLDELGLAMNNIGATRQIFTNPADRSTACSITGWFG